MFKSKKQRAADKAAKKAAAIAKSAAAKKAKINKIVRPEPAKPAAVKVTPPAKPVAKPVAGAPVVKIHMLANAMIDGTQYVTGQELTVSMRLFKQIGTSCVSMAAWRNMQLKGGLASLRK